MPAAAAKFGTLPPRIATHILCIALLTGAGAAPVSAASGDCAAGAERGVIASERDAACYLLYLAEELLASRDWCAALSGEREAWDVTLAYWVRRNRAYLDAAVRVVGDDPERSFSLDSPLLADRRPAIEVDERQCEHDRRHVDQGRFDVDLVPRLRPIRRLLSE